MLTKPLIVDASIVTGGACSARFASVRACDDTPAGWRPSLHGRSEILECRPWGSGEPHA